MQVFDMRASLKFYREKLGFELLSSVGAEGEIDWALLKISNVELMLNTAYEKPVRPPAPDPERIKAHHDITIFFGCPDVDAAYFHLSSKGVEVRPPSIAPYGMKQIYLTDPDGYNLCFHWPVREPVAVGMAV